MRGVGPPRPRAFGRVNWIGLGAMIWRDLARVVKSYRDTVLGAAVSGILFLAVFSVALGGPATRMGGEPLLHFLAPGLIALAFCQQAFETSAASLVFDKLEGIVADLLMAPLTAFERTLGYALSAGGGGLLCAAAVLAAFLAFTDMPVAHPWAILYFACAGAGLHALLGALAGLWARRWDHYSAAQSFLVVPLGFLSGAFYSLETLPEVGRRLVQLNPVFYVVDGFRYGFTGRAEGSLAVGALVLLALDAALLVLLHRLLAGGWRLKA